MNIIIESMIIFGPTLSLIFLCLAGYTMKKSLDLLNVRISRLEKNYTHYRAEKRISANSTIVLGNDEPGTLAYIKFTESATLIYNPLSLILPGHGDIKVIPDDVAIFRSLGDGNWICINIQSKENKHD